MSTVPGASVLPVLRRANVRGALTVGLGRRDAIDILSDAAAGSIDCLVLVGSDPIADCPDTDLARRALAAVPNIIAIDTFATSSSAKANVLLPAAAFGEKDGTTTNRTSGKPALNCAAPAFACTVVHSRATVPAGSSPSRRSAISATPSVTSLRLMPTAPSSSLPCAS
ncbi:MAG: hypothetical protein EBU07_17845 [Betaproteobacteria bacterium]|nr:hypothetical protein [Betaproteobacteria bacterium]